MDSPWIPVSALHPIPDPRPPTGMRTSAVRAWDGMGLREWQNIWKILRSIDLHEIDVEAAGEGFDWPSFRDSPHEYFIKAPDRVAEAIWKVVQSRMGGRP